MRAIIQKKWCELLLIPLLIVVTCLGVYSSKIKQIPISYWDEVLWVGRSNFWDFFIHGDVENKIWESLPAYDQPKLAEYAYGVWLYPKYLSNKINRNTEYDYTMFLMDNGFYQIDERFLDDYAKYKEQIKIPNFDPTMVGLKDEWSRKYGDIGGKVADLILLSRGLNVFLLAGAVVAGYYAAYQLGGFRLAVIFSFFYGLNPLIVNSGLKAHSEGLFMFTFNCALVFLLRYFITDRKKLLLVAFSIFTGLCMATKLNGVVLALMFLGVNSYYIFKSKSLDWSKLISGFVPLIVAVIIFWVINPALYSQPVNNTAIMFQARVFSAKLQGEMFPSDRLENPFERVFRIIENYYFSPKAVDFSGFVLLNSAKWARISGAIYFILFILGLSSRLMVVKDKIKAEISLVGFVLLIAAMSIYLSLDWARYYVPLSFFMVLYQSEGLRFISQLVLRQYRFRFLTG